MSGFQTLNMNLSVPPLDSEMKVLALILLLLGGTSSSAPPIIWTRELPLHPNFTLRFNNEGAELIMEMSAPTRGWVAVGFSPNGGMRGSDIVMGWVDSATGQAHIKDLHATGNRAPLQDKVSNYELLWGEETGEGTTTIRFSRPWNTCDSKEDFEINEDTIRLIWATGEEDPTSSSSPTFQPHYHGPEGRGGRSIFLKHKTHLEPFPDLENPPDPHIKHWEVRMNQMIVPGDRDTTYYCRIVKSPHVNLGLKHQIIGYRALIEESSKPYVHHINFFECIVPPSHGGAASVFEKYLDHPGGHCYHNNMPPEWGQYCMTVPFVWVAGAEGILLYGYYISSLFTLIYPVPGLMLPKEGGIPLGDEHNGTTYFMLEIHYDNPKMVEFEDSSGVRIFVTDQSRPNDIGAVTVHTRFSHGFHLIPPGYKSWKNTAFCTSECTSATFPPDGATITHATLHAHLTATKLKLRHVRAGIELEPIAQDDHYDFNYQQTRLVLPTRKFLPGDTLLVECTFDSSSRANITYGGTSTRDEMCQGYIYFYPRVQLALCKAQYDFHNFFQTLGISPEGVEKDDTNKGVLERVQLPYKPKVGQIYDPGDDAYILKNSSAGEPQYIFELLEVGSMSSSSSQSGRRTVSDYVESLPWRENGNELSKRVLKGWWEGNYDVFCTGHQFKRVPLKEYNVPYPKFVEWVKPVDKMCLGRNGRKLGASSTSQLAGRVHLILLLPLLPLTIQLI